jgi:antitoxin YobK
LLKLKAWSQKAHFLWFDHTLASGFISEYLLSRVALQLKDHGIRDRAVDQIASFLRADRGFRKGVRMETSTREKVRGKIQALIASHPSIINFGSSSDAVGREWIAKAEAALQRPLPDSYKWFLNTYAGGEIGGGEIFSLYGMSFEDVRGGDVVFQHRANLEAGLLEDWQLTISETDLGEVFFFDYSQFRDGECPIRLRIPSGDCVSYADDFYGFLYQRIAAHI